MLITDNILFTAPLMTARTYLNLRPNADTVCFPIVLTEGFLAFGTTSFIQNFLIFVHNCPFLLLFLFL